MALADMMSATMATAVSLFMGGGIGATLPARAGLRTVPIAGRFAARALRVGKAAKTSTRFVSTAEGVVYDLKLTLDRIASGGKFPHRNDGSIFKNIEGLLPKQNAGYYKEFVHPTPGVKGPGAMRVVTGKGGEMWFTPDHYKTFIPIK
jgi:guanyl-specific ribonuclease Sa